MGRFTEEVACQLALRIVGSRPGATISYIKEVIEHEYCFSAEDLEPLANRPDLKYTQIIRNLTSHYESNEFGRKTTRTKIGNIYHYELTSVGKKEFNIDKNQEIVNEIYDYSDDVSVANTPHGYDSEEDIDGASNRKPSLDPEGAKNNRFSTDPKLGKTAIALAEYTCELCDDLPNKDHISFETPKAPNYVEAHHLIPMKAQKDFGSKNLDRIENIVCLCPNCHKAVHYGNRDEKVARLKPLYDRRIKALKNCKHHIDIDFDVLINKYY